MARPGDELTPSVEEPLEARSHLVERAAQLQQLARPRLRSARAQIARCQSRRSGAQAPERLEDSPAEKQGSAERAERRDNSDGDNLDVVVHAEHDQARREHHSERQANGEQRQRDQLRSQRRQQPHDRGRGKAGREDSEGKDERDGVHARKR